MPARTHSAVAGGVIAPSIFIKYSTAADNTVLAAGSGDRVFGISTEAAQDAPITGASTGASNGAGSQMKYYPTGEECLLLIGSGGVTRGDLVSSDGSGNGVTVSGSGTAALWVGAIALESAAAGEYARVQIVNFPVTWT